MGKTLLAAAGAVAAALGSTLCCAGPLIAVSLGVSGAGLAATVEPLRPYLVASSVFFLGLGYAAVRRADRDACVPGRACASPAVRRRMKRWLAVAAILVALLATFPWWSVLVLS
jgi:mercuric ion transport protein